MFSHIAMIGLVQILSYWLQGLCIS